MNMRRLLIHMLMQTGDIDESETMALDQYGLCIEHLDGEPKTRMESALALFNVAAVREDLDQMRRWAKELEGSEFENGAEELIQNVALTSPVSKSDDALKD